jgi:chromosome segregation ATPase
MRHLLNSAQAEEKLNSVYDGTVKLQESLTDVGDRIREAMVEFGELAYRSRDNGVALTSLKEKLSSTQATAARSASDVSDGLAHMNTALESIGERQNVATQASTQVLDYIRDVARRIKGLETTLEATAGAGFEGKRGVDSQQSLELLESVTQNLKSLDSHHGELTKFLASLEAQSNSHAGDVTNHLEAVGAKIDRLSSSAAESKHLADKMLQKITDEVDVGRQVSVQIEGLKVALDGIKRAVASRYAKVAPAKKKRNITFFLTADLI